jgi:hypothetical protein
MAVFMCEDGCESLLTEGRGLTLPLSWLVITPQTQKMEKVFDTVKMTAFSDDVEFWRKAKPHRLQLYAGVRIETRTVKEI